MPEEQDEETAEEEGEEMKAVKRVFLGELWRGKHVVGDLTSCPEYETRNELIEARKEYSGSIRVQD